MIWRQQLADYALNRTGLGLLKAVEGGDTLVSAVGRRVQSWDATDGRLVWEWKGQGEVKAIGIVVSADGSKDALAVSEEEGSKAVVRKLAADTGDVLWEITDARYIL